MAPNPLRLGFLPSRSKIYSSIQKWYILVYTMIYRIVDLFEKHKINYAIAGGFAVALHGAVRGTIDLDLVVHMTKESYLAVEKALLSLGFVSHLPVTGEQVFDFKKEYIENKNLIAWSFTNRQNPAEVVDIIITEDLRKMKVDVIRVADRKLRVLSVKDLIKMKKKASRPQDLEDIKALEELKK